jgi:hypothetical protein
VIVGQLYGRRHLSPQQIRETGSGKLIQKPIKVFLTFWLAPGRRVILLTVFRKTRMREDSEVKRAKLAHQTCQAEHEPAHQEFTRTIEKGELDR